MTEDDDKKLQSQKNMIHEIMSMKKKTKVKTENATTPLEEAGLTARERSLLQKLEKVEEKAEERAKKNDEMMSLRWDEVRALVSQLVATTRGKRQSIGGNVSSISISRRSRASSTCSG